MAEQATQAPAIPAPRGRGNWGVAGLAVGLALLALLAYWPALKCDFVGLDDDLYVTNNPPVQHGLVAESVQWAFQATRASNWHPLTWLSHMADSEIYGSQAWGHHLTNLLFHAANTVLLFWLLWRLTGFTWRSVFVAALFAVHPLHVESVAWVSERKDVLSTFLGLVTLLLYRWHCARPGGWRMAAVAVVYALGLTAKPMLVSWPLLMLLLDFWPLRRLQPAGALAAGGKRAARRLEPPADSAAATLQLVPACPKRTALLLVLEKWPLWLLAGASCRVTYWVQNHGGSVRTFEEVDLWTRFANALCAYAGYLVHMVWPAGLNCFYPYRMVLPPLEVLLSALGLIAVTVVVLCWWRRQPYLPVGWLWYGISLGPVVGLVQVGGQSMADRYTYVPLIGVFIMIAWGVPALVRRCAGGWADRINHCVLPVLAVLVLAVCVPLTWRQCGFWQDSIAVFSRALAVTNDNALAHNNLGVALTSAGRYEEGGKHFEEALRLNPKYADAHSNLGVILGMRGQNELAALHFREAATINPGFANAHYNLGMILQTLRRLDEAEMEYRKAVDLDPFHVKARVALSQMLADRKQTAEAIAMMRDVMRIRDTDVEVRNNLAWFLAVSPESTPADHQEALALAEGLMRDGAGSGNPMILDTLAAAQAANGRFDAAQETAKQAIKAAQAARVPGLAADIGRRLQLFCRNQPYQLP
ncbi:MAG: tetratricopeptide repeat protein [Lentisphaeria bacterium]